MSEDRVTATIYDDELDDEALDNRFGGKASTWLPSRVQYVGVEFWRRS